ncbi:carbamoyltransferase HypF [Virgisporangium ochraceum]|uniref:Carbamoyltransferase n=1 Tax=Virgisporangium ochraceum TaxID=65505 RepID=A0A8J4EED6_9ACTN|nr:carbamoyltransferase HypF [Virgisporangium ochraceum]GIJ71621.1 carbamoyltransferase [Virgisporangium ochraceum]
MTRERRRFDVSGVVQGVGFRPFVYVTASALSLTGSVSNDSAGVVVEVEGEADAVAEFAVRLRTDAPPLAAVDSVRSRSLPVRGGTGFTIAASRHEPGGTRTLAAPDVATCADCLAELTDPADRRYRHPFVTCTNCGPRFTIITGLPYDRPATTMAGFPMCPACAREYADPADRRFHAQPIACHDCGPTVSLVRPGAPARTGADAIAAARAMLAAGAVLAVKGLGGYHLACDAADGRAVALLRRRKRRVAKPFAVMARDLDTARTLVAVGPAAEALLSGPRRPIVLLPRRPADGLADAVAPGNPDLGVLLPYTPLHVLLFGLPGDPAGPPVLVMTSGNLGGEPIVTDDVDARERLAPLVDGWLTHDRPIHVPCDDSVVRMVGDEELPVRRSRGYAPLPVALPVEVPATLAVGADLKNTFALARGRYAWLGQHIGEMDDLATLDAFTRAERHLEVLTGVDPAQLAADAHPAYRSAAWARRHADGRAVHPVQHHHAHVAAVMAEHGLSGGSPVIGIAFDGTGYGPDGAIWGGEVLLADYKGFHRFARLRYVPLPGGDAAVERPYRMALAHLAAAGVAWDASLPPVAACPPAELAVLRHQLDTGLNCVPTSSMGRLFDAVASLAGVRHVVDYEAQAAIELEGLARGAPPCDGYRFTVTDGCADPGPVIRDAAHDVAAGVPAAVIGARFHRAVTTLVVDLAVRARDHGAGTTVALTGGVFQNALLLAGARDALRDNGFTVLCHRQVPPNDGGLALGQVLVAASGPT